MKLIDRTGYTLPMGINPCGCCGMTYTPDPKYKTIQSAGKGIRVLYGHIAHGKKINNTYVNHVKTKNGELTVVNRSE